MQAELQHWNVGISGIVRAGATSPRQITGPDSSAAISGPTRVLGCLRGLVVPLALGLLTERGLQSNGGTSSIRHLDARIHRHDRFCVRLPLQDLERLVTKVHPLPPI